MKISTTVINVGDFLKDGKIYSVPIFQRSYSWDKQELAAFYDDLIHLYENPDSNQDYFIGSMVFTPHEDKSKIYILDGQQRFATFLIFLAALRDVLHDTNIIARKEWITEFNSIIFKTNTVTLEKNPKLELNRDDRLFFEEAVVRGVFQNPKYKSHKLIKSAYKFFKNQISTGIDKAKDKYVRGILAALLDSFVMIKIDVDSDINAHIIFETLNDRGLDLSVADLVKNYLFSLASSSGHDLEVLIQIWKEIVDQVGDHNVTTFLRHYWISSFAMVRKDDLYKEIKSKIEANNVIKTMQELAKEATVYSNLINPTHEFWADNDIESALEDLRILRAQQVYTLLLAFYKNFHRKPNEFKKLLQLITNFTFRYNTICSLNPNDLEFLYSKLSIRVRKTNIKTSKIIDQLLASCPTRETFIGSFLKFETKNSKLARYILANINDNLLEKEGKYEQQTKRGTKVNIEHVIPKKPDQEWSNFFRGQNIDPETLTHKIGNMTILLDEYNRKIANKFFDKKQVMYKNSSLPINKYLKSCKEFSETQVKKRQKDFAEISEKLWNIRN